MFTQESDEYQAKGIYGDYYLVNRPEDIKLKAICLKRFSTDAYFAYGNNSGKLRARDHYFTVKGFESTIMHPENMGKGGGEDQEDLEDIEEVKNMLVFGAKYFSNPHIIIGGVPGKGVGSSTGPLGRIRERSFVKTGNSKF